MTSSQQSSIKTNNGCKRLILGSSSPYRKELLSRLQIPFEICIPNIDETALPDESPETTAMRLAQAKAQAIAAIAPDALIIASDQVATLDGEQIGKPGNHANALLQLQKMRGRRVIFHTALCVWDGSKQEPKLQLENIQTFVTFRDLPDAELDAYLRIEQPYDCAGSAKNEGLGIAILEKIESIDPTALTGLPLIALTGMLRRAGVSFFTQ
ncbi:Maf family nucleotide pyrophosphatase [Glaciimonas soli]|uniref:7-methyl-GTP pyrophosphatase n=1 Tax=Glaciimonas soli TaxID=2590999 RepID=A0A843YW28_9BURK|nr:Maf family nucleotide pyrophosphatase [Glaciimonas soli]MQR01708.1 septum formation protein Maf [Glaciimonas soli]